MVYDLAFDNIEPSSLYDSGTAYTKTSSPLLYVHRLIADELQNRLYEGHAIVMPIQEPNKFTKGGESIAPHLGKISRMMKSRTTTIIVEVSQSEAVWMAGNVDENEDMDDGGDEPEQADCFWDRGGSAFAKRLTRELLAMKAQMPSVTTIKLILWFGDWVVYVDDWKDPLIWLKERWDQLEVEIQLNLFDYEDQDAGDGGLNWIQCWEAKYRDSDYVHFSAIDLHYQNHLSGQYMGREFDPTGWESPVLHVHSYQGNISYINMELHTGVNVKCRPLFVEV